MVALATFLAAFPVVLSALNLAVPRNAISFGFSGINMAFAGLLPLLLGVYARERFFPEASIRALPAVFFPLVGWMAFLALPVSPGSLDEPGLAGLATAVAGILLGLLYASSTGVRIRRALRDGVRGGDLEPRLRRPVRHRRRSGRRLPGCRVPRRSDGTRQRSKNVRSPAWVLSRVHRALHPARGRDVRGVNCPSVPLAAPPRLRHPIVAHRAAPNHEFITHR